ncbi:MAG: sugar porter family MFS transporter [Chlamydiae bacterium CG10_big_fil_rev_8_21_14_0_10_35_9]|nr:MAG: sugar porter family MFS transporter [Chlamydiae bacterium CG10_big_fil_rev_8_21_14_0_10_35_9]
MSLFREKPFAFFILLFAALGGLLYGYDIGVISGALLFIQKDIPLSTEQTSLVVAAVLGGGSIATLISGPMADWIGRKKMIILAAIIVIIGTILLAGAYNFSSLLLGRLIQGISIGIITIVIPLYIAEATPKNMRGRGLALFQLILTLGILLAYAINLLLAPSGNWRGMFYCVLIPGFILFLGSLFIPESPVWLFSKGKKSKAKNILQKLRLQKEAEKEFQEMEELKQETHASIEKFTWQKHYFLPLFLALSIGTLNQLTGINVILQFITIILKDSGLQTNLLSLLGSIGIGLINFIITIFALVLVDKIGRKPLLLIGTGGIVLSLFFAGVTSFALDDGTFKGTVILISLVGFICSFAIGPGVVVWLAVSEILPNALRSKGMAVALFLNSISSTIYASFFLSLAQNIGFGGIFMLSATFSLIYFLITYFYLPETKHKTLEEIEEGFRKRI